MEKSPSLNLESRAQLALEKSHVFDLRSLHVERTNGSLLISGVVSSFYHKQLAQEVVRHIAGNALQVVNSVKVT